ncbi:MAG: MarR family winged helix-turn-helix transcriptional regulator [Bosea sp. (in: a-proteobacteria)]
MTTSNAPPPSFVLLNEIGIINQLAGAKLEAVLPYRMTMPQFRILNHFVRMPGERNINRLAQAFQVAKPTMGGVVESLRKKDLISLRPDPDDKRSKLVAITHKGIEAQRASIKLLYPDLQQIEDAMGADFILRLLPDLQRLRKHLDENR